MIYGFCTRQANSNKNVELFPYSAGSLSMAPCWSIDLHPHVTDSMGVAAYLHIFVSFQTFFIHVYHEYLETRIDCHIITRQTARLRSSLGYSTFVPFLNLLTLRMKNLWMLSISRWFLACSLIFFIVYNMYILKLGHVNCDHQKVKVVIRRYWYLPKT